MNITKRRNLLNTFFLLQLNYCPLTWMCHSLAKNIKLNRLHERCLRILYNDKVSNFEQILEKESSVSMQKSDFRFSAVDTFKVVKGLVPTIVNGLLPLKGTKNYN